MSWMLRMFLMICLIAFPLFLYVGLRLAGSLGVVYAGMAPRARMIILLVIIWLYLFPAGLFLLRYFGMPLDPFQSDTTVTWLDYIWFFPIWVALIIVLELTLPFVVLDILGLVVRFVPAFPREARPFLTYARIFLAAAAVLYVSARVVLDTLWVRDSSDRVAIKGLPPELEGLTLTLVADVQVDRYTGASKVGQVRRIIESHHPDLLLYGGDLVTSGTEFLGEARSAVCGLHGSLGTFAVMGDHDIWSAPQTIRSIFEGCGWTFLANEHAVLRVRGKTILVSGLTHVYSDRLSLPDLRQFLQSAPQADLKILLVHQPAEPVVRLAAEYGYTLVLAGHTHGGQIVFHPLGIPFTPSMRETRYYSGVYQAGPTTVVVTRGVGLSLAPVRYSSPAQVSTIVLSKVG